MYYRCMPSRKFLTFLALKNGLKKVLIDTVKSFKREISF